MTYTIQHRPAPLPGPDGWSDVATVASSAAVADELAFWRGPCLAHGDLVRAIGRASAERLWVFDADTSQLWDAPDRQCQSHPRHKRWRLVWESPSAHAGTMAAILKYEMDPRSHARSVRRRITSAACAIVRMALAQQLDARDARPSSLVDAVERWGGVGDYPPVVVAALENARKARREAASSIAFNLTGRRQSAQRAEQVFRAADVRRYEAHSAAEHLVDLPELAITESQEALGGGALVGRDIASILREHVPLSVVLCAVLQRRDPLPLGAAPKPNRRRR